ncbi:MAG: signal recognition particle protein [Halothiobacillus sp. 24-54-40]|jgi:signal recognition particle subunit SRP54|nr:signal recognition particle protein [Halothiobacillaceae bacterium]OYV46525.1 MAG: signal recognition particle protein [Halothiobacillus sp. 20-53-49]OYY42958.1 MAG: signal recognition particle protein [Halothiobacillus sp. 35-54-62]OYY55964.1 MAG: signal recognition particle protein [Halothiobacillus sp. 28-55-5]OYZ88040.1 MAG: signal recognition particle protein [Halothiobacillus sp. 24-54-40]OZA81573.1 MAG: signal recognition particle protein [Halothiobacillus sp. 39-53-45]HQS02989.1 si
MFEHLSQRLGGLFDGLRGQGRLTEDNIKEALREVRMALLEADVALPVIRDFIALIKERAVGAEVLKSLKPGQVFIKIVSDELTALMGEANAALNLAAQPPAIILMAGLQGAGKTTTVGKLGRLLRTRENKKVLVVSADVYRPAAIKQLQTVAQQVGVDFFPSEVNQHPLDIVQAALKQARTGFYDVLIVDTAGRLHVDAEMMAEVQQLHAALNPVETLFVVDAMTGQDAANTAKAFNEVLPLTGVILTKADGDARGGAALSVRAITGKPIKFIGMGEKLDALEPFHPERIASRILGMGDVVSLVEEAHRTVDTDKAKALADKVRAGKGFTLEDMRDQFEQMQNMGGIHGLMDKLPGMGRLSADAKANIEDKDVRRMIAIINSMTIKERQHPDLIKGSRKKRIALGSGMQVHDVNRLLKQHRDMSDMMKKFSGGGMKKMMRALKGRVPGLPM